MIIHLAKDLADSVRAELLSGNFATEDELVAEAVRAYLGRRNPVQSAGEASTTGGPADPGHKPIWEVIEEENRSIPQEVWDALPTDLSAQHDHYIYGTPKRPAG